MVNEVDMVDEVDNMVNEVVDEWQDRVNQGYG